MFDKVLPIGSVISLYGQEQKWMILGYTHFYEDQPNDTPNDYCACPYPQGYMGGDSDLKFFEHIDIEHVYGLGFQNEAGFRLQNDLREILEEDDLR